MVWSGVWVQPKYWLFRVKRSCQPITSQEITIWTPASPALPYVVCQSLSAAAPFIQSQQAPGFIPRPALSLPPFTRTLPHAASHYLPMSCRLPPPPFSPTPPAHFLPFCKPPLLHPSTLLGPDEPLWDSSRWMGNKGVRGGPPLPVPPCITANQALGNLLKLSRQSNE